MANRVIRTLIGVSTLMAGAMLATGDVQANRPPPPSFPPIDPSRVDCAAFRGNSDSLCYDTANDLHQLFSLIFTQFAAGDFANAEQDTPQTTPQLFPDGEIVVGTAGSFPVIAAWAGSNDFSIVALSDTFIYRPLDAHTVVVYGGLNFTIDDREHGEIRTISDAQTEVFRRNQRMPRGWEMVYEQIGYVTPLLGDR